MARRRTLDDGVWARRAARRWLRSGAGAVAGAEVPSLSRSTAGRSRLALWSRASPCLRLQHRTKRPLRHLLSGEEAEGHVPDLTAVAKWRHFAAWRVLALRERSEALAQIEKQKEVGLLATNTVAC